MQPGTFSARTAFQHALGSFAPAHHDHAAKAELFYQVTGAARCGRWGTRCGCCRPPTSSRSCGATRPMRAMRRRSAPRSSIRTCASCQSRARSSRRRGAWNARASCWSSSTPSSPTACAASSASTGLSPPRAGAALRRWRNGWRRRTRAFPPRWCRCCGCCSSRARTWPRRSPSSKRASSPPPGAIRRCGGWRPSRGSGRSSRTRWWPRSATAGSCARRVTSPPGRG